MSYYESIKKLYEKCLSFLGLSLEEVFRGLDLEGKGEIKVNVFK